MPLYYLRIPLVVVSILFSVVSFAQSVDEIKAQRDIYLWGEGSGTTLKRADEEALADLISQISVSVSSSFENEVSQVTVNGETDFEREVRSIISTYSQSALTNTERIVISNEPDARVLRFIKRADVNKVFKDREAKVYDFVELGDEYVRERKLADALRYYNWALALLKSHPDAKGIRSMRSEGSEFMHAYIVDQVNYVLDGVQFVANGIEDDENHREVRLECRFNGEPVSNLDYIFWHGTDWSRLHTVKDGHSLIDFFGEGASTWEKTNIKIEYAYTDHLYGDQELEEIFEAMEPTFFTKATREVDFDAPKKVVPVVKESTETALPDLPIRHELELVEADVYKSTIDEVVKAIRNGGTAAVQDRFTAEGYELCEKLLLYGKARKVDDGNFQVYRNNDEFVARGVYMSFEFQGGRSKFVEEVVFHFNEAGKINGLVFGLGEVAIDDIYNHPVWSEEEKFVLVDFLEQYKTAYALKRIDYLEAVFDDNAVIITGTVLKKKQALDGSQSANPFADNKIVRYNRFTKTEYINRLRHVFGSKEFINIRFEDNTLRKSNANPNLFGVQIKQNYRSDTYSDQGYLFLLIDFTDRDEPVIHVRTWQPEKDPDGRIYGLEDF
jgi:hypothetical protein